MIIIPISHEDLSGRRWPYVTGAILLLNVVIFLSTHWSIQRHQREFEEQAMAAYRYHKLYPYLEPTPLLDKVSTQIEGASRKERLAAESVRAIREDAVQARGGVKPAVKARRQARLDKLCEKMAAAREASPLRRYAYTPAENNWLGMITSQFLHGGWMHLIFNMLFLWLAGCNIDQRRIGPLLYLQFVESANHLSAKGVIHPVSGVAASVNY